MKKKENEDLGKNDSFVWKISNLGGAISNATIYPTMYVLLLYYNEDESIDITLEIMAYYSNNFYYRNSDGTFYVKDDKEAELFDFIDEYTTFMLPDGFIDGGYKIIPCFTLHYADYNGDIYNDFYTIVDDEFNDGRKIFGDTMKVLEEISELLIPDVILPLDSTSASVITIYYKNAETKKVIYNEQEYNDYSHAIILDQISSTDKPINEMYGDAILSDRTLWIQNMNTRELSWVDDDVKEFAFAIDSWKLTWITENGDAYIMD